MRQAVTDVLDCLCVATSCKRLQEGSSDRGSGSQSCRPGTLPGAQQLIVRIIFFNAFYCKRNWNLTWNANLDR